MQSTENEFGILPELERCLPALTPQQLEQLRASLKEDGMIHGITLCSIDELPGRMFIADGHTRYREAKRLDVAWKVDSDVILNFDTVAAAVQWVCKFQASRRNLTPEQFSMLLGRYYNTEKREVGANQHSNARVAQNDPPTPTAQKVAKEFGVGPATVKRAGSKTQNLERVGLDQAVMDGTIKSISEPALAEIVDAVNSEPKRKKEIADKAIEAAKANDGKVRTTKKTAPPEPEDGLADPERARTLDKLTRSITEVILSVRKNHDADFVARFKSKVLEAFKTPLPEVSKAPAPEADTVMPMPATVA